MFALHLCFDGNFISDSYFVFEKYYPNSNLFLIGKELYKCKLIKCKDNFTYMDFENPDYRIIDDVCRTKNVDRLVLHGMSSTYIGLTKYLSINKNLKIYWLFWGYELYISLAQMGKYSLIDGYSIFSPISYIAPGRYNVFLRRCLGKKVIYEYFQEMLPYIDYFCFWNYEDYKLLKLNFNVDIQYKFFAYNAGYKLGFDELYERNLEHTERRSILINHQASLTGNHLTIMNRINAIDCNNQYKKICPLSYGSKYIRKIVLKKGTDLFLDKFFPVLDYMPSDEYFDLITSVGVAFIGAKRQEASGNIINLLGNGVKVFLREDNNLLRYYRDKGFIVFSFDKDFNSIKDLEPLSLEEQEWNRNCRLRNRIYYEQFMPSFFND